MYYARGAVAEMGLNRDCMVALAMLMGGDYDYIEGIKVVGLVNIMEILDAFDVGCG
jgi:5'-3' exonuclease